MAIKLLGKNIKSIVEFDLVLFIYYVLLQILFLPSLKLMCRFYFWHSFCDEFYVNMAIFSLSVY